MDRRRTLEVDPNETGVNDCFTLNLGNNTWIGKNQTLSVLITEEVISINFCGEIAPKDNLVLSYLEILDYTNNVNNLTDHLCNYGIESLGDHKILAHAKYIIVVINDKVPDIEYIKSVINKMMAEIDLHKESLNYLERGGYSDKAFNIFSDTLKRRGIRDK